MKYDAIFFYDKDGKPLPEPDEKIAAEMKTRGMAFERRPDLDDAEGGIAFAAVRIQ